MPRLSARVFADNYLGRFRQYERLVERRMEAAALIATDVASRRALTAIRQQMQGAGLGRLGNAIAQTSDMQRQGLHRRGTSWSASGMVYIRSGSKRTRGAIESYTVGADIRPTNGRWLWIATEEAGRLIGSGKERRRLTPALYRERGEPLGPLTLIHSINGNPLMVVQNVGKNMAGARGGRVRSLTKSGRPRKGDRLKTLSVLFVAIPRTSRAARVDVNAILKAEQRRLPELFYQAVKRTTQ